MNTNKTNGRGDNAAQNFKAGDRVVIAPKWDGDGTVYVIVEWNIDRGVITPLYWDHGVLRPQELATADMIELQSDQAAQ